MPINHAMEIENIGLLIKQIYESKKFITPSKLKKLSLSNSPGIFTKLSSNVKLSFPKIN